MDFEHLFQFRAGRPLLLTLLPCGHVKGEELDYLVRALSLSGMRVVISEPKEVPASAFDAKRHQYRAALFFDLARSEPGDRVLAVTDYDLYVGDLSFVFGLAESGGRSAVISLFRLRIGASEENFRCRTVKEAIHELGPTFGLIHCTNPGCAMYFSNSLADTDRKGATWCDACRREVSKRSRLPPLSRVPPEMNEPILEATRREGLS
jgi:archaemetzincin